MSMAQLSLRILITQSLTVMHFMRAFELCCQSRLNLSTTMRAESKLSFNRGRRQLIYNTDT